MPTRSIEYSASDSGYPYPFPACLVSCVGFAAERPRNHHILNRRLVHLLVEALGDRRGEYNTIEHRQVQEGQERWGISGDGPNHTSYGRFRRLRAWIDDDAVFPWHKLAFLSIQSPGGRSKGAPAPVLYRLEYHDRRMVENFRCEARVSVHIGGHAILGLGQSKTNQLIQSVMEIFSEYPEIHQGYVECAHRVESHDGAYYTKQPDWPISLSKLREMWEWNRSGSVVRDYVRADSWGVYIGPGLSSRCDPKTDLVERFNSRVLPTYRRNHEAVRFASGATYFRMSASPFDQVALNFFEGKWVIENISWLRDQLRDTGTLWHLGLTRTDPLLKDDYRDLIPEDERRAMPPDRYPQPPKPQKKKRRKGTSKKIP
jgi:hypothetical protein